MKRKTAIIIGIIIAAAIYLPIHYYYPFLGIGSTTEEFGWPVFNYPVEYDDLVPRRSFIIVALAVENIPKRSCFTINENGFSQLSFDLRSAIHEAQKVDSIYPDSEIYDNVSFRTSSSESLELISKYQFDLSTREYYGSILKIPDTTYRFECFFEFHENQYKMIIEFDGYFSDSNIVNVNFTTNTLGLPVIQNENVIVYYGGFNNTVLFHNHLDKEIALSENTAWNFESELYHDSSPLKYTIPPGKFASHYFTSMTPDDIVRSYEIEPYNLEGTVIVKHYPRCMKANEVKSLYSQVGAYPKFPSYVPEGYSFECGIHNLNAFVYLAYWNDELRQKFEDKANSSIDMNFFASGGITVDYYNEFVLNFWTENPDYDKFEEVKKREHPFAATLTIGGNPAIMIKDYFWDNGEQKSFNQLMIFTDNEVWYRIRSGLPEADVIKIAESLFES